MVRRAASFISTSVDFTLLNSSVKLDVMARTGRRPGETHTRYAILGAARKLFAERGYAGASMRAIAAEAGVDASLVVHFFGSKAGLLVEAIEWPFDPEDEIPGLLADGPEHVGAQLARLLVDTWDREGSRHAIMTLLRAATIEPRSAELLRTFIQLRLFGPLLARLGSDQPEIRGELCASQMLGLGLARYVIAFEPLASADGARVVAWAGPTLQRYLTSDLG
jgi:AcrR family transcriptional regulator